MDDHSLSLSIILVDTVNDSCDRPGLPGFLFRACRALTASIATFVTMGACAQLRRLYPCQGPYAAICYYNTEIWAGNKSCGRLGRAAPRPGCCTPIPYLSWHSHCKLKGKRSKQRGGTPGGARDDFGSGFVGYGGFCKATIDMYGK